MTTLRNTVNARLKGLSDEAEAASHHGKHISSSRIVQSLWKGWFFQQKVPHMSKKVQKSMPIEDAIWCNINNNNVDV
jgi:hypothetical protein